MMMFVVEKPSFTLQMHPVHKLFGLIMIASALAHISLNYKALFRHLKQRSVTIYAALLVTALVLLYGVAINNKVPEDLAERMDAAAAESESRH